jgi:hypothetical protein
VIKENQEMSIYRKLNLRKKFLVWAGIAVIIGLLIALLYIFFVSPESTISKYTSTGKSVQSPGYQAGGNNQITQITPKGKAFSGNADVAEGEKPPFSNELFPRQVSRDSQSYEEKVIQSIIVETRLTYELRDGAEVPPDEIPFVTVGDANSYLVGPDGNVRLDFISPVGFRMRRDGRIVVINHFSLQTNSDLYGSPVESLKNFDYISLPVITADYGSSLNKLVFFKASLSVNGQDILLSRLDRPTFQLQQGTIRIPLGSLKQWVDIVNPR